MEQYHKYRSLQSKQRSLTRDLIVWETWDLRTEKDQLIRKGADDDDRLNALQDQIAMVAEKLVEARLADAEASAGKGNSPPAVVGAEDRA